jgi:DNA polymerase-3 subunit beta
MEKFTINLRALKAVSIACGKEETRYYLTGVLLEYSEDGLIMVATDGRRLVAARQEWIEDRPKKFGNVIVSRAQINEIKLIRDEQNAQISFGDEGTVIIEREGRTHIHRSINGVFPDWRRAVPSKCSGKKSQLNVNHLADFYKAAVIIDGKAARQPIISHNAEEPCLIDWRRRESGLEVFGVLMPMRTSPPASAPDWAVKKAPKRDRKKSTIKGI